MPAVAAVLLGLAPFTPEPHLVEKFRWITTGQEMRLIDWGDVLMHGAPVVWLAVALVQVFVLGGGKQAPPSQPSGPSSKS